MSTSDPSKVSLAPDSQAVELGQAVRKHLPLMLSCFIAVLAGGLFWTLGQSKVYRAETMLRLDPDPPKPLGQKVELISGNNLTYWNRREFYETEFRVMRSKRVALAVVRSLSLHQNAGFLGRPNHVSPDDAADILIGRLSVQPIRDSSLVMVHYEDTDQERCQLILNAVVRIYLSQNLDNTASMSNNALEWLNTQLGDLKVKLESSEVALKDFREKNHVLSISLEDRHNILAAQMDHVAKDLVALEGRKYELAARYADLAKVDAKNPRSAGAPELLSSIVLSTLRTSYDDQRAKLEELLATADENNPRVLGARKKLDETAISITSEISNIKAAAAADLRRVTTQIANLKGKQDALEKQAHELQAFEVPYNQLARAQRNNEKIYGLVLERARETDLTRMMNFNNIRVIDEAVKPKSPYKPNVPLNLAISALLGAALGVGLAFVRELADRSLRTPADVESTTGLPCLGLLPEMQSVSRRASQRRRTVPQELQDRDLIVAAQPDGGVAEAARAIRTNLTFMSPDKPYRSIAVTSAIPEEGKTTVACSLATVLAQSGLRVLLVDTDLRRPRLHRTFRVSNDLGVTLAVTGQATLDECIHETSIKGLSVLTSGPIPPNPAEMLQSARFTELVNKLLGVYDRVIFDSPPLLPVTDAAILSKIVDGTVVVVRGFRTQRNAARHATRLLRDVKAHVIGVVLNAVDLSRRDYREYHYYYGRRGYYSLTEGERETSGVGVLPDK